MRLIDANAMRDDWLENGENEYVYDTNAVLDSIDSQPTVDAVSVVRCLECKYGTHFGDMEDEWIRCMGLHGNPLMPFDGFCSYGERKEGDD